jgi:hypothetical protein
MPADRRRIIAIVAALTVFAAAGVFWLARVVLGGTGGEFVAGTPSAPTVAAPTTVPEPTAPTTTRTTRPPETDEPGTITTTRIPRTPVATRTPSSRPTTSRPAPPPPPVPTHAILVGGAKLDNDTPRDWCATFENKQLGIQVTVTSMQDGSDDLRIEPGECGDESGLRACRVGLRLDQDEGCFAETTSDKGGNNPGTVRLGLRVRCTSLSAPACDVPVLRKSPPTPARPAVLTWRDRGKDVCYRLDPDGGTDHLCTQEE